MFQWALAPASAAPSEQHSLEIQGFDVLSELWGCWLGAQAEWQGATTRDSRWSCHWAARLSPKAAWMQTNEGDPGGIQVLALVQTEWENSVQGADLSMCSVFPFRNAQDRGWEKEASLWALELTPTPCPAPPLILARKERKWKIRLRSLGQAPLLILTYSGTLSRGLQTWESSSTPWEGLLPRPTSQHRLHKHKGL